MLLTWSGPLLLVGAGIVYSIPTPPERSDDLTARVSKRDIDDYNFCLARGHTYWQQLLATLSNPNPVDRVDGPAKFDQYYGTIRTYPSVDPDETLQQDLKNNGYQSKDVWQRWVTYSIQGDGTEDTDTAYQNLYDPNDGIILAQYNHKSEDSQQQLQWSEIVYQTYVQKIVTQNPAWNVNQLSTIIQNNINNVQARGTILQCYSDAFGADFRADKDDQWRVWTYAANPSCFKAIVGTDNVRGTVYMLNDHPNALGKKIVSEIWTRMGLADRDIWIKLEAYTDYTPPPTASIAVSIPGPTDVEAHTNSATA